MNFLLINFNVYIYFFNILKIFSIYKTETKNKCTFLNRTMVVRGKHPTDQRSWPTRKGVDNDRLQTQTVRDHILGNYESKNGQSSSKGTTGDVHGFKRFIKSNVFHNHTSSDESDDSVREPPPSTPVRPPLLCGTDKKKKGHNRFPKKSKPQTEPEVIDHVETNVNNKITVPSQTKSTSTPIHLTRMFLLVSLGREFRPKK
jgi:hypothetical protein